MNGRIGVLVLQRVVWAQDRSTHISDVGRHIRRKEVSVVLVCGLVDVDRRSDVELREVATKEVDT